MTITEVENPASDEYYGAELPDTDPAPGTDGPPPDGPDAPFGWTRDQQTKQWRPKKSPGRPKAAPPPSPEDVAAAPPVAPPKDEPPPDKGRHKRSAPTDADVPMPKGGVIAKGVNKAYRRIGKALKIVDVEIGQAFIECTRPDPDDPDLPTVGEAWEALAAGNPRIRAWLLNAIKGSNWQELVLAHAPIGMALASRTWVRGLLARWFPRVNLEDTIEMLLEEDEDTEPSDLRPEDVADMQATAQATAQRIASRMGVKVPPGVADAAMRQAQAMADRQQAPEAFTRTPRPPRQPRAKRRGKR